MPIGFLTGIRTDASDGVMLAADSPERPLRRRLGRSGCGLSAQSRYRTRGTGSSVPGQVIRELRFQARMDQRSAHSACPRRAGAHHLLWVLGVRTGICQRLGSCWMRAGASLAEREARV